MPRVNIPSIVRAMKRTTRFTARTVTKAARAAGMNPTRGVVGTALWRMTLTGELSVLNGKDNGATWAYWTGKKHRIFIFNR